MVCFFSMEEVIMSDDIYGTNKIYSPKRNRRSDLSYVKDSDLNMSNMKGVSDLEKTRHLKVSWLDTWKKVI